jgi:hypothetical protein
MPPELWTENPEYSDEVDVWEYGCTLYECAVGRPPNSDLRERQQLKMRMRRLKQAISLPESESHSDGLRSLVSYALSPDVASRPSMKDVLEHDFLKDTDETHPTHTLTELVQTYYAWLFSGGQRVSLFMPGGAAAATVEDPDAEDTESLDEWNFSMTQDFERRVSAILEIPDFSDLPTDTTVEGEATPKGSNEMTAVQKANFEARVMRGADLSNLFDQTMPAYEYRTKTDFVPIPEHTQQRRISDLPFRAMAEDRPSSIASNVIDLGDFDEADYAVAATPRTDDKIQTTYAAPTNKEETIRLADAATLREKRANSKGPRDNQSLTARRTSSTGDPAAAFSSIQHHDFAASQEEWTVKNGNGKAPELQGPAEIVSSSSRPGHATMDWSFASAMSEAAAPQVDEPENPPSDEPGSGPAEDVERMKKHATMDWSFSSAMAEVNTEETHHHQPGPSSRPTPTRPAPLTRQMTMPVTVGDFGRAEEREIPRPSTAMSEAYSDVSGASTDVDPFGLERDDDDDDDDEVDPEGLEDAAGPMGMGGHYAGRGRAVFGGGRPVVSGGPPAAAPPAAAVRAATTATTAADAVMTVDVPPASPPAPAVLGSASPTSVEAELTRLLEGMQGTLNAAGLVVGGLERRATRDSGEWEDEE